MSIKDFKENNSRTTSADFSFYSIDDGFELCVYAPGIAPESIKAEKSGAFVKISGETEHNSPKITGTLDFKNLNASIKVGNDVVVSGAKYNKGVIYIKLIIPEDNEVTPIKIEIPEKTELNETKKPRTRRTSKTSKT